MSGSTSWECTAFDGEKVRHGENFVPGPDYCTACKCEKGEAQFCRAALCQPRQDCKSFRVGDTCCDFICLDDILPTINKDDANLPSPDTGLRMVASAITAILSLALLLFLIHRLRQRKLRIAQHQYLEEQLDALGVGHPNDACRCNPCCRNAIYLTGNDHVDFFLDGHVPPYSPWKPPSYYFQPSEAPPPYSEVVASDRALVNGMLPSLNPLMVQLNPLHDPQQPFEANGRSWIPLRDPGNSNNITPQHEAVAGEGTTRTNLLNSTIRSDEVYEISTPAGPALDIGRRRPLSMHDSSFTPPSSSIISDSNNAHSLNDLNKGTTSQREVNETERQAACLRACSTCDCSSPNVDKCNVCSTSSSVHAASINSRTHAIRDEIEAPSSAMKDFELRLKLDISDSSSSTDGVASGDLSLESASSKSSGTALPFPSNLEASC